MLCYSYLPCEPIMIEMLMNALSQGTYVFVPPTVVPDTPYKGWVSSTELISGEALATLVGLTAGTSIDSDAGWMHFIDNGKEFYIARRPFRYGVTVASMKAANQLVGKDIQIGDKYYRCRLMSCLAADPIQNINTDATGGEWNSYMYPIFSGSPRPSAPVWSYYTAQDLGIPQSNNLTGLKGALTVCKEQHWSISTVLAARCWEYNGTVTNPIIARKTVINDANPNEGNGTGSLDIYGWRPVLEVIPPPLPEDMFYGEVAEADFITAAAFTTLVGMSSIGTAISQPMSWLKYRYKGKTTYMAKKPLRYGMTWESMNALGIVKGETEFTIGGKRCTVALPTGADATNPTPNYNEILTGGSFNDLIYPVYGGLAVNQPVIAAYPRWAAYTDAELLMSTAKTNIQPGHLSWCQEVVMSNNGHLVRGYNNSDADTIPAFAQPIRGWYVAFNGTQPYAGWRPIITMLDE